ncbi:MAG: DUF3336 domain-containing protein [Pseudomonadales bacterium]|nr:DUF3336 domain-containing protein [Pseudomonadales bacterium]
MPKTDSYATWHAAATAADERSGAMAWRRQDASRRYDYKIIKHRLSELRAVKTLGDVHRLLYWLNEGIHGNMGGIGSSSMYTKAKSGTKFLVSDYLAELADALEVVARASEADIPFNERLEFFRRASHCFGRTALMLSGGGSLGPFHVGVIKALSEQHLLPNVISGSSAGSIITAIIGTRKSLAISNTLGSDLVVHTLESMDAQRVLTSGSNRQLSTDAVRSLVSQLIPDVTFQEAFEETGRQINITVSPKELHQHSRLLNAITSPNVYLREAVLASCAVPGVFPAVTLAAKNVRGERQPYVPSRQWVDGSMTDDLPAKRLARLYGVNHFITSQINPLVTWAMNDTQRSDTLYAKLWEINQNATREWLKATYPLAMQLTRSYFPLNVYTRMFYNLITQDYTADINILPERRYWDPRKLLSALSEHEVRSLIEEGERQAWPKIEMIRNCTLVSRTLDRILADMEKQSLSMAA